MEQPLTITNLNHSATRWIENESQRTGVAIEDILRKLIYRGLELENKQAKQQRFHDLDSLAGTWSSEEAAEFAQAIEPLDQIDPTLWQ